MNINLNRPEWLSFFLFFLHIITLHISNEYNIDIIDMYTYFNIDTI